MAVLASDAGRSRSSRRGALRCGVPSRPQEHGRRPADRNGTDADYVALGHWHVNTDLSTRGVTKPAWYSGAPMFGYGAGRMLLVDLVPGEAPLVRSLDVLDHPASRCATVSAA